MKRMAALFVSLATAAVLYAGGAQEAPATVRPEQVGNESPMLSQLVQSGELPPLEQRLPDNPLVVGSGVLIPENHLAFQPGRFGGTLRLVTANPSVAAELYDANNQGFLRTKAGLRKAASLGDVLPNLAENFDISDDMRTLTFTLRSGLRWSDGEPVTTEDVRFAYEDVYLNREITDILPAQYRAGGVPGGEPFRLEIVDDLTFRLVSPGDPNVGIVEWFGRPGEYYRRIILPSHHLKQFHRDYADPEELQRLLSSENLSRDEWWRLFSLKNESARHWNMLENQVVGYPRLSPWILEERSANVVTYVRNPYYWKVDPDGRQLPYIDRLRVEILSDSESVTLRMLAGDVDWMREYASMANYSLYKEHEARGDFSVHLLDMHVAPLQIAINFSNEDAVWRQVVGDVRFREAMNIAINSEQVIDLIYNGFGEVPEWFPSAYDPDRARMLLDQMGLDRTDSDGWRIGPDGDRFVFRVEAASGWTPELEPFMELLIDYWQAVGVRVDYRTISRSLYQERFEANEVFARVQWAHTDNWRAGPTSQDWAPDVSRAWRQWIDSSGAIGVEPPAWAKQAWEIAFAADTYLLTDQEVSRLHGEMKELLRTQVPAILAMDFGQYPIVARNNLRNIPSAGQAILASWSLEQFYFE